MRGSFEGGDAPEIVMKAAMARSPKLHDLVGRQSRQVRSLLRFMPEGVVDRILRKVNGLPA